jgi:hypothetical protein
MNFIVKETTFWDFIKVLFEYVFIKKQEIQISIKPISQKENTTISIDKPTLEEKKEIEEFLKSKEKLIVLDEI